MKTLINKRNSQIRITAPEIIRWFSDFYVVKAEAGKRKGRILVVKSKDWTLVEEEKTIVKTIKEFVEKGERCMQQAVEDHNPGNYTFWDGFHNCAENILREVEEPTEGIKGNLEEIPSNVDLEKEIKKHTDLFQADIEYPLRLTAIKFYELGLKARKEE